MNKLFKILYNTIKGVNKMKKTYTIIIHKEEDGYWGECKELEGCFAQAKTVQEVISLMQKSIYLYFENDEQVDKESKDIKVDVSYA